MADKRMTVSSCVTSQLIPTVGLSAMLTVLGLCDSTGTASLRGRITKVRARLITHVELRAPMPALWCTEGGFDMNHYGYLVSNAIALPRCFVT